MVKSGNLRWFLLFLTLAALGARIGLLHSERTVLREPTTWVGQVGDSASAWSESELPAIRRPMMTLKEMLDNPLVGTPRRCFRPIMNGKKLVGLRVVIGADDWENPLREVGLQDQDVVIKINGLSISGPEDVSNLWRLLRQGSKVTLLVKRKDELVEVHAPDTTHDRPSVVVRKELRTVCEPSPVQSLVLFKPLREGEKIVGLRVVVEPGYDYPLYGSGLQSGDIITKIDGHPIDDGNPELTRVLSTPHSFEFEVERRGKIEHLRWEPTQQQLDAAIDAARATESSRPSL